MHDHDPVWFSVYTKPKVCVSAVQVTIEPWATNSTVWPEIKKTQIAKNLASKWGFEPRGSRNQLPSD